MKFNKSTYILFLAIVPIIVVFGSCKKSHFNINKNPNDATDSTISYNVILPSALHSTGAIVGTQWGWLQNWMGFWARSGTYAPNVIEETYQINTGFQNGIWNNLYDNAFDYQIMEIKAKQAGATFYQGIARMMKAHNFQILVDVYGNIPYKEALKGAANSTPRYDKADVVYKDLLRQIDTAMELIRDAVIAQNKEIATNDIMFGGNKTLWLKFGNTLKLRMLVHLMNGGILTPQSSVAGFDYTNEFTRLDTFKLNSVVVGFFDAGQNAMINPGYKSDKPNPFYTTYKFNVTGAATALSIYYRANEWGIDYYTNNSDPRRSRFYTAGPNGYVGVKYGLPPTNANIAENLASIGPALGSSSTVSQPIMMATESLFLQAEARYRGFLQTGSSAENLVNAGITESFVLAGVPNPVSSAATYMLNHSNSPDVNINALPVTAGEAGGGLFTIISQKWFALNGMNTLEVWTDWRRTHYSSGNPTFVYGKAVGYHPGPAISVSPQNTSTRIPIRLLYPTTEYNYNPVNVGGEGTINQFTSRIFWDVQ
jgi:Starch-binding associating with outer membrane